MPNPIKIFMNNNADMSKGKYAAQAVHCALNAAGVEHGSVVVLGGPKKLVESMHTTIHDAGLTELRPGTLTAGTDWEPENTPAGRTEDEALLIKQAANKLRELSHYAGANSRGSIIALAEGLEDLINS